MQKKFVALCLLASVSVMSVRAMDKTIPTSNIDIAGERVVVATSRPKNEKESGILKTHVQEYVEYNDNQIRLIQGQLDTQGKSITALNEKIDVHGANKRSLSLSDTIGGTATGLFAAQWVLASQKMGLLTSVVKPLGAVLYNTGMTVPGIKSVLPTMAPKITEWFSSAAAYKFGGYSMSGAKAFVGSHAGCFLATALIVKTFFDVFKGMKVKDQENNTKTAFECYWYGLKQARKDAINLDPNIGDKEAAKRHVDDKMKQGRAIVATGMRFFGNRFVQNVKLPGKVVIGLSDYMRKAIIS